MQQECGGFPQLPSAEAVAASAVGSHLLAAASAASDFECHAPFDGNAPYQQYVGSHAQSYEPVQAVAEAMADHGAAANTLYQATRKRGRPPGSKNKPRVGPPKTRKGRSHDDDWYQSKFALQADVAMVCLAAVDKRTGFASRGATRPPPYTHQPHRCRTPLTLSYATAQARPPRPSMVPCHRCLPQPPRRTRPSLLAGPTRPARPNPAPEHPWPPPVAAAPKHRPCLARLRHCAPARVDPVGRRQEGRA